MLVGAAVGADRTILSNSSVQMNEIIASMRWTANYVKMSPKFYYDWNRWLMKIFIISSLSLCDLSKRGMHNKRNSKVYAKLSKRC